MIRDIQKQYDLIYSYFKTTAECCDCLNWNGDILEVILNNEIIEQYSILLNLNL